MYISKSINRYSFSGTVAVAMAVCLMAAWCAPAWGQNNFVQVQDDQFVLDGQVYKIKGTNYYPRDHMWANMWSDWDWAEIQLETQKMHDFGLNAVRILVPYSHGGWNGPNVPNGNLQMLEDIVNLMGENGIRSVVTIFDWETSFPSEGSSTEADHLTYLSTIVNRLKDNPYVLMWDVKNEPDHPANYGWCDCNPGSCGNWDCNPSQRDKIVSWLHRMCDAVRDIDPNHPASAGMRWWQNLPDVIDFMDVAIFHSYDWPIDTEITDTKNLMGANQKPIVVEEWGWPSHPYPCYRDGQYIYLYNENYQLQVYQDHLTSFIDHDIAGGLQWMTFDADNYDDDPDHTFEDYFGLWRYGYTLKPAAEYYRDNYPANQFPGPKPGAVSQFTANGSNLDVELNWQNPSDDFFAGTMIRHSTDNFPSSPSDGTLVCDRAGEPGSTDSFVHTDPQIGVVNYYAAFAYSNTLSYADPTNASATARFPGDYDLDFDLDQSDFGTLQACLSGQKNPFEAGCEDADLDHDGDADIYDVAKFQLCATGAGITPQASCLNLPVDGRVPDYAYDFLPEDGTTGLDADVVLNWSAGTGATSHDVYLGMNNPPALKGNQAGTSYTPSDLEYETTYYWRIDERNDEGVTTGTVHNFTTKDLPLITNLNRYEIAIMNVGVEYYRDSSHTITSMPSWLYNQPGIRTNNADAYVTSSEWITFTLNKEANVYVAYDSRGTSDKGGNPPNWLTSEFTQTSRELYVTDSCGWMRLYKKTCQPGGITLGGNMASGAYGAQSNYFVIVWPLP